MEVAVADQMMRLMLQHFKIIHCYRVYPAALPLAPVDNLLADLIDDSRNPLLKVDDAVRISLEGYYKKSFNEILKEVQQKVQQRKLI